MFIWLTVLQADTLMAPASASVEGLTKLSIRVEGKQGADVLHGNRVSKREKVEPGSF